jgi:nuclear pore complex protein Nup93
LARDNAQPLERSFTEPYKQSWESGQSVALRQRFIYGGRRYLESQLFRFIEKTISQQPREAAMGGRPGVYEKIKGYLNIRLKQYGRWDSTIEIANDTPIWAIIFYLIRCGFWDDAVATAIKFEKYFDREDPNFVTYLKAYVENSDDYRLPKHLRNQIIMEYTQKTRQQADRFKLAIYKVLGRCDLSRKTLNDVIATKEDYIWLQLSLIRETPELDFSTDSYCLADLQALLIKFGPEHFSAKNSNPLNYFQVLLLCFQFERVRCTPFS